MKITRQQFDIYDRVLATLSTAAIIAGGIWTLVNFIAAKNKENQLLKREIELAIFNDKKTIYYELCEAEGEIAACNTYDEVLGAQKHFRRLYVGRAHIISEPDSDVYRQKVSFRKLLDKYIDDKPQISPFKYFHKSCLQLTDICRKKLDIKKIYEPLK